jgi:S1-C subfamily serine protease
VSKQTAIYGFVLFLAVAICATGLESSRAQTPRTFDFHYSVFALATNTSSWAEADADLWGTAFVIDRQGTMVTANHVVKDLLSIVRARVQEGHSGAVLCVNMHTSNSSSVSIPMKVLVQREDVDIAVLRPLVPVGSPEHPGYTPPFQPLDLDGRGAVNITETVYIVGYPINAAPYLPAEQKEFPVGSERFLTLMLQTDPIVTTANVVGVSLRLGPPTVETKGRYLVNEGFFLLNHPGGPGNSGGPVISAQTGKVIGIFTRTGKGYSFAVPTTLLPAILKDLPASTPKPTSATMQIGVQKRAIASTARYFPAR